MRLKTALTFALALVVILGVGVGTIGRSSGRAGNDNRTSYTPVLTHQTVVAGAHTPENVIAAIIHRYGGTRVAGAAIGSAPAIPGIRPGLWLRFSVDQLAGDDILRPEWEANLVSGAISDALATYHLAPLAGTRIDVTRPDGQVQEDASGGVGDILSGQSFSSESDSAIVARLRSELASAGLAAVSIDLLHADQPAPVVIAKTDSPAVAAADARQTIRALFGADPPYYEGYYFEVMDSSGDPVFIQTAAFRLGVGGQWVNPSYAGVTSLIQTAHHTF